MYMSCPRQHYVKIDFVSEKFTSTTTLSYIFHNTIDSAGIICYCQKGAPNS